MAQPRRCFGVPDDLGIRNDAHAKGHVPRREEDFLSAVETTFPGGQWGDENSLPDVLSLFVDTGEEHTA